MKTHSIIDISWTLKEESTSYKNNKPLKITHLKNFPSDGVRDSLITLNSHTGTHIDAPSHFLAHGKTIEHTRLEALIGTCIVLDLTHVTDKITQQDLIQFDSLLIPGIRVLLKTTNSYSSYNDPFNHLFIYLDKSGAEYFAKKKIATVGIDYLGIERNQPDHETHTILMEHNITIIEGLRLAPLNQIQYHLICLPIAVNGLEAAPARAVVIPL